MELCKFIETVKTEIKELCGEEYQVLMENVLGNNGEKRVGISVRKKGETSSPLVYLNSYYDRLAADEISMEFIVKDIYSMFMTGQFPELSRLELKDFKKLRERVTYRLINRELNKELLKSVPYVPYCDLAIVFCLLLDRFGNSRMTSLIYKEHLKMWGTDTETLYALARDNTSILLPARLRNITDVLREIAREYLGADYREELIEDFPDTGSIPPMYVLSNTDGIYGAAAVLYDGVLKDFSEKLEKDLLLLPSSVHEMLVIPYEDGIALSELEEMVRRINKAEVPAEEVLADHVYRYSRETEEVSIAT